MMINIMMMIIMRNNNENEDYDKNDDHDDDNDNYDDDSDNDNDDYLERFVWCETLHVGAGQQTVEIRHQVSQGSVHTHLYKIGLNHIFLVS